MELSYWESRWNKGKTGFHMDGGYPGLGRNWSKLNVSADATILVPLCGKTEDLIRLSSKAGRVIGVEISKKAVEEFFSEKNLKPETTRFADFTLYSTGNIEIWCGDFMKLPPRNIRHVQLIYDKAALVALPPKMRESYAKKVQQFCGPDTKILLHHFVYEQQEMPGPPFSVPADEINDLFSERFSITLLEKEELKISEFQKFAKRGLKSYLIEYLLLLLPDEKNK